MELTYHEENGYLLPDLEAPEAPALGKYGLLRRTHLRTEKKAVYTGMQLAGTLDQHLLETDRQAEEQVEAMTEQLAQTAGATEALKAADPLKWAGLMNSCKQQAEEVVLQQLVYI